MYEAGNIASPSYLQRGIYPFLLSDSFLSYMFKFTLFDSSLSSSTSWIGPPSSLAKCYSIKSDASSSEIMSLSKFSWPSESENCYWISLLCLSSSMKSKLGEALRLLDLRLRSSNLGY
jgi:hypothetical protein